jgi:hypothetical protein
MDVVFHAAGEKGRAFELFGDAAEIRVQRVTRGFVDKGSNKGSNKGSTRGQG